MTDAPAPIGGDDVLRLLEELKIFREPDTSAWLAREGIEEPGFLVVVKGFTRIGLEILEEGTARVDVLAGTFAHGFQFGWEAHRAFRGERV